MIGTPTVVVAVPAPFRLPPRNGDFSAGLDGWQAYANSSPWTVGTDGKVHPGPSPSTNRIGLTATPDNMVATGHKRTQNTTLTVTGYTPVAGTIFPRHALADSTNPGAVVSVSGSAGTVVQAGDFTLHLANNLTNTQANYMGLAFLFQPTVTAPWPDLSTFTVTALTETGERSNTDLSCITDDVSVKHGRDDASGQPDASSATINLSFDTTGDSGGQALLAALYMGAVVTVAVVFNGITYTRFVGGITDIVVGWEDAGAQTPQRVTAQLVAVSPLAILGRTVIGDTPWPQELDGARATHIFAMAGVRGARITYQVDPGTVQVLPRDFDAQPALGLLHAVAESAEGTVWQRLDGTVCYADAYKRTSSAPVLALDGCDLLASPSWKEDLQGLINSVSIGYGDDTDADQARITASNLISQALYGLYDYSVGTELATAADARTIADDVISRQSEPGWNLSALPIHVAGLDAAQTAALLALDMHALIQVDDLPDAGGPPAEAWLWVEGWSESLAAGAHEMALAVTDYARSAGAATWDKFGPATWDDVQPALLWDDARTPPKTGGPAWDALAGTWDALAGTWTTIA